MDERQKQLDEATRLRQEVLEGTGKGEPIEEIYLKMVKLLALRDGDLVSYDTVYENIKTIYGMTGLKQKLPMLLELGEFEERVVRLREYHQSHQGDEDQEKIARLGNTILEHEARIERLKKAIEA